MRVGRNASVLRNLDSLFRRGVVPSGDGALLERFLAEGDDSAFEALVVRHGPMVLGVCRRILISPHDADDAFQATSLVLAALSAKEGHAAVLSQPMIRATLGAIASSATAPGVTALTRGAILNMFPKSTVTVSFLAGGLALAGMAAATWMTTSRAQG